MRGGVNPPFLLPVAILPILRFRKDSWLTKLIINVDGGSRGNPGPAGAGVVIRTEEGRRVFEAGYFLGRQTNNAAEYHALIRALQCAQKLAPEALTIHSDSELLVRQLTGEYQVKSPGLAPLFREAQMLLVRSGRWNIRHVRREQNARADELANLAMERRADAIVFDCNGGADPPDSTAVVEKGGAQAAHRSDPEPDAPDEGVGTAVQHPQTLARETDTGPRAGQAVRITVARQPTAGTCPTGGFTLDAFTIGAALPGGLCIHAAHALLPTALAILNTAPEEFAAVPALTVRCAHPECGAEFKVAPVRSENGQSHTRAE
jgi:ribonuclease HI